MKKKKTTRARRHKRKNPLEPPLEELAFVGDVVLASCYLLSRFISRLIADIQPVGCDGTDFDLPPIPRDVDLDLGKYVNDGKPVYMLPPGKDPKV